MRLVLSEVRLVGAMLLMSGTVVAPFISILASTFWIGMLLSR